MVLYERLAEFWIMVNQKLDVTRFCHLLVGNSAQSTEDCPLLTGSYAIAYETGGSLSL